MVLIPFRSAGGRRPDAGAFPSVRQKKSRAVKPGLHPRLPPFGGSVGRSSAEDGWGWLFALGVPVLPAQKRKNCARLCAPCVRQNWGDRANSHPQPLLIRLARLSGTKPRGCPGIRFVRRPYAVREKGTLVQWQYAAKVVPERKHQRRRSLHHRDAKTHLRASSRKWRPCASTTCAIAGIRRIGKSSACGRDRAAKKHPHAAPLGLSSAAMADRFPGKTSQGSGGKLPTVSATGWKGTALIARALARR